jgi:hypothetical protein
MNPAAVAFVGFTLFAAVAPQQQQPVIAQMEEIGTVYLTWREPGAKKKSASRVAKNAIIGIDFRPMAGSDPKKIAALIREWKTLPDLETVLLLGQDVTDEVLDAIPSSAKITSIRVYNSKVTDKGVANLTRFQSLRDFNYTGAHLTDEGMKALNTIRTLNSITITDAPVTDVGVMALRNLRFLQRLTIENSNATEKAVQQLRESLPRLNGIREFG